MNYWALAMVIVAAAYAWVVWLRPGSVLGQLLEFRAACLWRGQARNFLRVSSLIVLGLSILWFMGLIWVP